MMRASQVRARSKSCTELRIFVTLTLFSYIKIESFPNITESVIHIGV